MKKHTLSLIFLVAILGCTTMGAMRTWTVQETKDWYKQYYVDQPKQPRPFVSQLYHTGSDDKYHYFTSRSMDEWVFVKLKVGDLQFKDVRPKWTSASKNDSTGLFGYYAVDPLDNFKRIQ